MITTDKENLYLCGGISIADSGLVSVRPKIYSQNPKDYAIM